MWIAELWRYPVKSMAGEQLEKVQLREDGIVGDRIVQVIGTHGRLLTSRSKPKLLGHKAVLGPDGEPLVDNRPWTDPKVAASVRDAAGPGAHLVCNDGMERFDVLPLLVATDGAIAAFGYDKRRLRPNIIIGGVPGLAERDWEGKRLRVNVKEGPVIGIENLRERCIMTTFDPDTQEQDVDVLLSIHRRFQGTLALNCWVVREGELRVGDPVELIEFA
jgi:uncharacterized protein YcbX